MPFQPTPSTLNIANEPLMNLTIAQMQKDEDFITRRAAGTFVESEKQAAQYYTYPSGSWNRLQMQKRANMERAARGGYTLSSDSFSCEKYGVGLAVGWDQDGESDPQVKPSKKAPRFIENQIRLKLDSLLASDILAAANWTTQITGVASGAGTNQINQWNGSVSDPQDDILSLIGTVKSLTGFAPNTLIVGFDVHQKLITNSTLRELRKYNAQMTVREMEKIIGPMLGVDNYMVGSSFYNSAEEGQTASMSFQIDPENAWLGYMDPAVAEYTYSAWKVFCWTGGDGPLANRYRQGVYTRVYDEVQTESTIYEGNIFVDLKVIAADAGVYITDAVA